MKTLKASSLLLVCISLIYPVSAFFGWGKQDSLEPVTKQVIVGEVVSFSSFDFQGKDDLQSITFQSLPENQFGELQLGGTPLSIQETVEATALSGLKFFSNRVLGTAKFEVIPQFFDGTRGEAVEISIEILDIPNEAPLAKDMDLFTYQNIAITCYFDTVDSEGDFLTYQITAPPARGSVTLPEDGSSSFLYTPYENKTGRDDFQYIATDSSGNVSNEGTVSIRIEKPKTVSFYADMQGHPGHKAAVSLAEAGVLVGECVGNQYLFSPEKMVSREEFLSLAMSVVNLSPLEEVEVTGFYDDASISVWSKGYVSSAVLAGVVQGTSDDQGRPVFQGQENITMGEAAVILNQLLQTSAVSEVSSDHWASQASANLSAVGVETGGGTALPSGLNRGEVAELLDSALALFKEKQINWTDW